MDPVRATYRIDVPPGEGRARAEALALEQTAELPRAAVGSESARAFLGGVESVEPAPDGAVRATIAYPAAATAADPAQLLNVVFGNAALLDDVTLVGLDVGASSAATLGGPRHGIDGLRAAAGVEARPLTCAALKPMGDPVEALAQRCEALARAGIDVIKDDHGLADFPGSPLADRLDACAAALDRAAEATGRRALYVPNLIGSPRTLARGLERVVEGGAGAVLVAPLLAGLPAFRELARESPVPVLAHPAWASPRVAPETLLGTLFRLFGADAVVFPHAGGRFPFDEATCRRLADELRRPVEGIRPALPVPAGGMSLSRVAELVGFYGSDTMLLVGGTLYVDGAGLEERARTFVRRVADAASAGTGRPT
ncbi:MAG: ribulose 1,5-bisphosphate carboxylase [Gemmatimonadetes bacterium]|nr:ribulose 1,5-bisphosphate carboxylase [Gemmatimonadota bacterium]